MIRPNKCPLCLSNLEFINLAWTCPKKIIAIEDGEEFNEYYFYEQITDFEKYMFPSYEVSNFFDSMEIHSYINNSTIRLDFVLDVSKFNSEDKIRKLLCLA